MEKVEETPEQKAYHAAIQLETNVDRLQRKYELLEKDRKIMAGVTDGKSKLTNVIRILKKEHLEIQTDLNVAASDNYVRKDNQTTNKLRQLLAEHDEISSIIDMKKTNLKEINEQIVMITKQMVELKAKQISRSREKRIFRDTIKVLEALENKLDTENKRLSIILTENRTLREGIDHHLRERVDFNISWEKLINTLVRGKKYMMDLIEQSTIAYDEREEWCQKLQVLRTRAQSDFVLHVQEMRELQRGMDHDRKTEDFLGTKGRKRLMSDLEEKQRRKRENLKLELQNQLTTYKNTLNDIMTFTGQSSVEGIIKKFVIQEEDILSFLKFTCELQRKMDHMSLYLTELHTKIDHENYMHDERATQQSNTLANLEQELESTKEMESKMESELHDTEAYLGKFLKGIEKLFNMCKCNNAPILDLLGDNTTINIHNVHVYLELLEQKLNELLITVYYKEKIAEREKKRLKDTIVKADKILYSKPTLGEIVSTNPCPLCVEHDQVSDVIDTLQFVLDKKGIQEKLEEQMELVDPMANVHNVSACHLPKSREIIQRRYQ